MYRFTRIYFSIEQAVYAHVYLCVLVCVCVDVYVLFIKMCLHYTFTHVYAYIYRFAHTCMGISVFPHTSAAVGMRGFRTYSTHFVYPATSTFLNNSVTEWEQSFFERVSCTWKVRNVMSCVCVCVCVSERVCESLLSLFSSNTQLDETKQLHAMFSSIRIHVFSFSIYMQLRVHTFLIKWCIRTLVHFRKTSWCSEEHGWGCQRSWREKCCGVHLSVL